MNRTKRHVLSLILLIALLAIPTAVFAKELGLLTISGPGIKGEMTIDHEGGMMKLERTGFFDQSLSIKPPENLGTGYNITAYLNLDGKVVPFVQMVYYAADENQPGYVHYTARLSGESLKTVDQWRQLNKDADTAFRGLMAEYEITLQPAVIAAPAEVAPAAPQVKQPEPAAAPVTSPTPVPTPYIFGAVIAAILALSAAGLILKRRAVRQPSA